MKWIKIMFYCYHSFAWKYDSYKGAVFYASFMSALVFILLLTNAVLVIELISPDKSGPFYTWPSILFRLIPLGIAAVTYVIIRTKGRYERILKDVDACALSNRQILKAKIVSIVVPVILVAGMSLMAFMLKG
jgi:hypothetical protein